MPILRESSIKSAEFDPNEGAISEQLTLTVSQAKGALMDHLDSAKAGLLGHLNLIQFYRESPSWSRGGVAHEEDGLLLYATDSAFPLMMNGVFRTDDRLDPEEVIGRADDFFSQRSRGFSLWVREGLDDDLTRAAGRAGLVEALRQPEMACTTSLPARPLPAGVEIRRVATVEDVRLLVEINASAYTVYGMRPAAIREAFNVPERFLLPHVVAVIAYSEGQPAATAMTLTSHGIAGVYWVGTLESHRGRGLGEAVAREATNAGFRLGARLNTLQASDMGEPIYKRLGYQTVGHYRTFVRSRRRG